MGKLMVYPECGDCGVTLHGVNDYLTHRCGGESSPSAFVCVGCSTELSLHLDEGDFLCSACMGYEYLV